MAKTVSGATDEEWNDYLGRWVPTGFKSGKAKVRGSIDAPATVKTTSLRNLLDAVSTFRAGR
jgi:hypothetical protein